MSHTTKIENVPITDLDALRKAVKDLQSEGVACQLQENKKPRMYYEQQAKDVGVCPFVLSLNKSRYDVGFQKQKDGSLTPVTDLFQGDVAGCIGAKGGPPPATETEQHRHAIGRLMAHYSKHATINAAKKKGYSVDSVKENQKTGGFDIVFETGTVVAQV